MYCGFRHRLFSAMLASAALSILCLGSCAGTSETPREEYDGIDDEFRQKFIEDRKRCERLGRTIVISGDGARLDRHGLPRSRVNYYCTRIKTI